MPQRQKQYSRLIHLVLHPRGDSESGAIGNLIFIAGLAFYQKMITVVPSQNLNPNVLMMKRARVALQARSWMVMEKPKLPGNGRFRSNNRDRRFESILLHHSVHRAPHFSENRSKSTRGKRRTPGPCGRGPGEQTGQRGKLEPGVNVGTKAGRRKPDEYLYGRRDNDISSTTKTAGPLSRGERRGGADDKR